MPIIHPASPRRASPWRLALVALLGVLTGAVLLFVVTLAMPVEEWRTGDQNLMPLSYAPAPGVPADTRRLWIDTDAACGASPQTDPDDCLAIALLTPSPRVDIVGVSTVFGNASLDTVDETLGPLLTEARNQTGREIARFGGADDAMTPERQPTPASEALIKALQAGPLVILALGPLTNVAEALRARPDLAPRVVQLVAVMGRRPGHLFHPAAGAHAESFLGHGPVMRDFNYAMDPLAVETVLATHVPLTLVPYDAAVGIELGAKELQALAATGPTMRLATDSSYAWLDYWKREMGRNGFYPFDLVAAAYLVLPHAFECARVGASVTADARLFVPFFRPRALLVTDQQTLRAALYCRSATPTLLTHLTPSR